MKLKPESQETLAHRQASAQHLSSEGRKWFNMIEFDANEELVYEIRKHYFGLFVIFFTGGFVMLAMSVLTGLAVGVGAEDFLGIGNIGALRPLLVLVAFMLIIFAAGATFISAYLYKASVIYVTTEKIAQIQHISLFNRKISQLSIGDVQDVTVTQNGILPHLFKYGTLTIETAGEQQNYTFTYVPEPYQASKMIVGAHERNLVLHGN